MTQPMEGGVAQQADGKRLTALRRFASAITVLNILGHTVLGFEQAWVLPIAALAAPYSTELVLELVEAYSAGRRPRFLGSLRQFIDFFLSAHISGLAVSMLLYPNAQVMPVVFAAVVAIGSKALLRAPVGQGSRHVFNPSNLGITVTLLAFPWVGIAPPYMFTENLGAVGDWLLPALIVASGSLLNGRLTGRLPLIAAWLAGFVGQAVIRSTLTAASLPAALVPMTGVAFVLYTFYMVTDPATTPEKPRAQVAFGAAVALVYGLLMTFHVVFGLFFALTIVSVLRGVMLWADAWAASRSRVGWARGRLAVTRSSVRLQS